MEILNELSANLQEGYADKTKKLTEEALAQGIPATEILEKGLIAGMNIVGGKFKKNEMYLPEVLVVARAMKFSMDVLKPHLAAARVKSRGKILLGTVKGDMHDIGKNLVGIMLQGAGFDVVDVGTDISMEKFVETVEREQPDVLGLSALLTTTMVYMKRVIEALEQRQLRGKVKVIVGGAPITQRYADEIKADGYARDASSAVDLVRSLLNSGAQQN
ncbi:MAG TPA: cobalamin-binding protein [Bacteroidetes bacterium]|nr:cobalamin-binding protein [Bacteroidota bacterium]